MAERASGRTRQTVPAPSLAYLQEATLLQHQVLHHPIGQVTATLRGGEFEYAAMRLLPRHPACELKKHRVINVQAGQRVQGRGREKDFIAALQMCFVLEGKGVAVVFFVEGLRKTRAATQSSHALVVPASAEESCHYFPLSCEIGDDAEMKIDERGEG